MKVIVLGAGVVGVTTAYYLARRGASVTLLDRHAGPAKETSFANAGQISPGYSTPGRRPAFQSRHSNGYSPDTRRFPSSLTERCFNSVGWQLCCETVLPVATRSTRSE